VKFLIDILLFSFFSVTVCPTTQLMASCASVKCATSACEKNESPENKAKAACCPMEMCVQGQCCFCYFVCPVDNKKLELQVFESHARDLVSDGDYALSDFSSDCWQPPEV
jgi:hypothetical protein